MWLPNLIRTQVTHSELSMPVSLIVGMGIGKLYASVLKSLGHDVVTVDSDPGKRADYRDLSHAVLMRKYDTVHICTPNYTHESLARTLALYSPMIFVEKPGFESAARWKEFGKKFPATRIMMVKNNQWRDNFEDFRSFAARSSKISIRWINKDRIPNPGSWFTTKSQAWGGVSRDLLPHLLSIFVNLDDTWMNAAQVAAKNYQQRWRLCDISNSDYGTVNAHGVYDVDDYAALTLRLPQLDVEILADWRSGVCDDIGVTFYLEDGTVQQLPLGLCPESAYKNMIQTALLNANNDTFWQQQWEQDLWIHQQLAP